MKKKVKKIHFQKKKRYFQKIVGNALRPRLSIFRSNFHIYAQLIDDQLGHTLVSASTLEKNFDRSLFKSATQSAAFQVGLALASRALEKEIGTIVFDKGKKKYHGRIQQLAEGAREKGLIF